MKRVNKILIVTLILIMMINIKVIAHGGNITGWNDKNSSEITEHNGKYYGYHANFKIINTNGNSKIFRDRYT